MAKKAKDERPRLTFRVDQSVYDEIGTVGSLFDMDRTALLSMMIARHLGDLKAEGVIYKMLRDSSIQEEMRLFDLWKRRNPQRRPREFVDVYRNHLMGERTDLDTLQEDSHAGTPGSESG